MHLAMTTVPACAKVNPGSLSKTEEKKKLAPWESREQTCGQRALRRRRRSKPSCVSNNQARPEVCVLGLHDLFSEIVHRSRLAKLERY